MHHEIEVINSLQGNRYMYKTAGIFVLLVAVGVSPQPAEAGDHSALVATVTNYRNAVLKFEQVVKQTRGIRTSDKNIVDRFEKATKKDALGLEEPAEPQSTSV